MTPELRAHVDAFAADCAADLLYIGKHRLDHSVIRVDELLRRHPVPWLATVTSFPGSALRVVTVELPVAAPSSARVASAAAVCPRPQQQHRGPPNVSDGSSDFTAEPVPTNHHLQIEVSRNES